MKLELTAIEAIKLADAIQIIVGLINRDDCRPGTAIGELYDSLDIEVLGDIAAKLESAK